MSLGHPESLEFPIPNGSYNITTCFLLIYEVSSVFIFINLLIAVINNTISKVDNNKVLYWQFTKASMQVSFFEDSSAIPCPWNLLSLDTWPARMLAALFGTSEEKFCGGKERRLIVRVFPIRCFNITFLN